MTQHTDTIDTFQQIMTELNAANAHDPLWWLTWTSCRDRFRARLLDRIGYLNGIKPSAPLPGAWQDGVMLVKTLAKEVRRWHASRMFPSGNRHDIDLIIVSILDERKLSRAEHYIDEYFGRLPRWLKARGHKPLVVGFSQGCDYKIAAAAAQVGDIPVNTFSKYLKLADILQAFFRSVFHRCKTDIANTRGHFDLRRIVREEIRHQRPAVLEGLLIERAMSRLLARHPRARIIHMFENNAWERGSYIAARHANPKRYITGYLHCAVLQSHRKYLYPAAEHGIRPMPDRIVTTGPAAAAALAAIGDYPADILHGDGVALRDSLPLVALEQNSEPVKKILVLLEGLKTIRPVLELALESASSAPHLTFELRCHPLFSYERTLDLLGASRHKAERYLIKSQAADLFSAVEAADVVLYSSSTSAFAALAQGKPLVHVPSDPYFNNDALFYATGLAERAETAQELLQIISAYDQTSAQARLERAQARQAFALQAMKPATAQCVELFLGS